MDSEVVVVKHQPEPSTVAEEKPELATVAEEKPELPTVAEEKPELAKVAGEDSEPTTVKEDKPDEAVTVAEEQSEPATIAEEQAEPAMATEERPEPTPVEEKPQEQPVATGRYYRFLMAVKASGFDAEFSDIFSRQYPYSNAIGPFVFHPCCMRLPSTGEDRASRIRSTFAAILLKYPQVSGYKLETAGITAEKDDAKAVKLRLEGNRLYMIRDFNGAIAKYSESLRLSKAPPFEVNTKDLLYKEMVRIELIASLDCFQFGDSDQLPTRGLAYASRSASFFEQGRYRDCLIDIVRALRNGYPKMRERRLLDRARKCCEMINKHAGIAVLKEQERYFDERRDEGVGVLRQKADENGYVGTNWKYDIPTLGDSTSSMPSDELYINEKVKVEVDEIKGRWIVALDTIQPGEVLVVEPNAHVSVLEAAREGTHCHHCYEGRDNMIPCDNCTTVMFCTQRCKNLARHYHSVECQNLLLMSADASLPVRHDVVRLFSSRGLKEFLLKEKDIRTALGARFCEHVYVPRVVRPEWPSLPNRAIPVLEDFFGLMHHSEDLNATDTFSGVCTAMYSLRILERLGFFREYDQLVMNQPQMRSSIEVRVYIAELLYYTALIIMTNSHAIKELVLHLDEMWESETRAVGAGCYEVTTYLNHSCVPNTVRDYSANRIVIRASERIPRGAELTLLYAKSFTMATKEERQQYLQDNFHFECHCVACENDWPVMEKMTVLPYVRAGGPCIMCTIFSISTNCVPNIRRCEACKSKLDPVTCYIDDEWSKVIDFLKSGHGVAIEDHYRGVWAVAQRIFSNYMTLTENFDPDRCYFDYYLCQELLAKCLQIRGRLF